jgi:hypothetical protein
MPSNTDSQDQQINLAAIRSLLLAAFTPEDLRRFCQDRPQFRPIVARFGPGHDFEDLVDRVMDYGETHLLWDESPVAVKQDNARHDARFEAKLVPPAATRPTPVAPWGLSSMEDTDT